MIFSKEVAIQQVVEVLHCYNDLHIDTESTSCFVLTGTILVNRIAKGFTLYKKYSIKIVVPICSDELPYVYETDHSISNSYPHRYMDGKLCLETDTIIRLRFIDGFSLILWMSDYVEPYFFSYEYFQRFGEFPFGERSHGILGIIETYGQLFQEHDYVKILELMRSIISQPYRGHMLCPCGSQKKLRLCHGPTVFKYYTDNRIKVIIKNDYDIILEALKKLYG